MNRTEIYELMSEHLKELKNTAKICDEKNLAGITSAMTETAEFLMKYFACTGSHYAKKQK